MLIKRNIGDGPDFEVIESCKNAFFRNPKTAGKNGELQAFVGLKNLPEQTPDQIHHLVVIAVLLRPVQGHVVFVDEKDHFLPIVSAKKLRQSQKAVFQRVGGHGDRLLPGWGGSGQLVIFCDFLFRKPAAA